MFSIIHDRGLKVNTRCIKLMFHTICAIISVERTIAKFWRSVIVAIIDHPAFAAHPPYQRYGFERTGHTTSLEPT